MSLAKTQFLMNYVSLFLILDVMGKNCLDSRWAAKSWNKLEVCFYDYYRAKHRVVCSR